MWFFPQKYKYRCIRVYVWFKDDKHVVWMWIWLILNNIRLLDSIWSLWLVRFAHSPANFIFWLDRQIFSASINSHPDNIIYRTYFICQKHHSFWYEFLGIWGDTLGCFNSHIGCNGETDVYSPVARHTSFTHFHITVRLYVHPTFGFLTITYASDLTTFSFLELWPFTLDGNGGIHVHNIIPNLFCRNWHYIKIKLYLSWIAGMILFLQLLNCFQQFFQWKKNLKVVVGHCQNRLKMTFLKEGVDGFIYFII